MDNTGPEFEEGVVGFYIHTHRGVGKSGRFPIAVVEKTRRGKIILTSIDPNCPMASLIRTVDAAQLDGIMANLDQQAETNECTEEGIG